MELLIEYMAKGFMTMLLISMPCVLVAAAVGLVVGILQAVTQVQEQTIAAAPKIIGVFLTIIILGVFYIKILTQYITEGVYMAFNIIPKMETYVLPADYYYHSRPFASEMKDAINPSSNKVKPGTSELFEELTAIPNITIIINIVIMPEIKIKIFLSIILLSTDYY